MDKWISVKDRLPEFNYKVLCVIKNPNCIFCTDIIILDFSDNEFYNNNFEDFTKFVTHWMTLPSPPNKE